VGVIATEHRLKARSVPMALGINRRLITGLCVGAKIIHRRVAASEIAILENDNPGTGTEWGAKLDPV